MNFILWADRYSLMLALPLRYYRAKELRRHSQQNLGSTGFTRARNWTCFQVPWRNPHVLLSGFARSAWISSPKLRLAELLAATQIPSCRLPHVPRPWTRTCRPLVEGFWPAASSNDPFVAAINSETTQQNSHWDRSDSPVHFICNPINIRPRL